MLALARDVWMDEEERKEWYEVYARLNNVLGSFANDKCLVFRKVVQIAGKPSSHSVYNDWAALLLGEVEESTSKSEQRVLDRRLDGLFVLRANKFTFATVISEHSVKGYQKGIVEDGVLNLWLEQLLNGANFSRFNKINKDQWPSF